MKFHESQKTDFVIRDEKNPNRPRVIYRGDSAMEARAVLISNTNATITFQSEQALASFNKIQRR